MQRKSIVRIEQSVERQDKVWHWLGIVPKGRGMAWWCYARQGNGGDGSAKCCYGIAQIGQDLHWKGKVKRLEAWRWQRWRCLAEAKPSVAMELRRQQ
nr:MAG TPA: hypothetical protein [Caudoviricetes sp.]